MCSLVLAYRLLKSLTIKLEDKYIAHKVNRVCWKGWLKFVQKFKTREAVLFKFRNFEVKLKHFECRN